MPNPCQVYEPLQVECLLSKKSLADELAAWLQPISNEALLGGAEVTPFGFSYVKGSTRAVTMYVVAIGAWHLDLDLLTDYPELVQSYTNVRVMVYPPLSPEDRLALAMGQPL